MFDGDDLVRDLWAGQWDLVFRVGDSDQCGWDRCCLQFCIHFLIMTNNDNNHNDNNHNNHNDDDNNNNNHNGGGESSGCGFGATSVD